MFQNHRTEAEEKSLFSGQWHSCLHAWEIRSPTSAELNHLVMRKTVFIPEGQQRIQEPARSKEYVRSLWLPSAGFCQGNRGPRSGYEFCRSFSIL